jgi:heterodisulfide reductase subunit A2
VPVAADPILVIGGGPAGLAAARGAADVGSNVILVEQRDRLGGTPISAGYSGFTPFFKDAESTMNEMAAAASNHPRVTTHLETTVRSLTGAAGDFTVTLDHAGAREERARVGGIVIATGFDHFDPGKATQMYGYYEFPDVITLVDAERMLKAKQFVRPSTGEPPERVCFVQCVGSRDRRIGNEYCSKVCCGVATKEAIEIRELLPNCRVTIFYIDMRMYGFWENQLYWKAQEESKVTFIRGVITEILPKGGRLVVKGEDTTMGRPVEVPMDVVVLSVGMVPSQGTIEVGKRLGVLQEKHGFIETPGAPLDTVSTSVPGIYVAGAAAGPKDLEDSVSMAGLAAMKAVAAARQAPASVA